MKKRGKLFLFFILTISLIPSLFAIEVGDSLHLNIQTTNSSGQIITGTFNFVFEISINSACNQIVYSNSTNLTTDSRGIISYYLENTGLNYSDQYWLCYYRNGILINSSKISRVPYSFSSKNTSLSGTVIDVNLNMGSYNVTTTGTGFFSWLGNLTSRITSLFVQNIDFSGRINGAGNINTSGNITASYFIGDGSHLTNLPVVAETDPKWTDNFTKYNSSWTSTYNGTYNTWAYNQTQETFNLYNSTWDNRGLIQELNNSILTNSGFNKSGINVFLNNPSDFVGIGTSTPSQKLNVIGDMNVTGSSYLGNVDFNNGWTKGGVSIINGGIYAQVAYLYNISGLDVSNLKVNGSLIPSDGFDNIFDLGNTSLKWRNLYLGGNAYINGSIFQQGYQVLDSRFNSLSNFTNDLGIGNWTLDKTNYYNKTDVDALNMTQANWIISNYYNQSEVTSSITSANTSVVNYVNSNFYNQSFIDNNVALNGSLQNYVPYAGAKTNVNLGNYNLTNISYLGIGTTNPGARLQITSDKGGGIPLIIERYDLPGTIIFKTANGNITNPSFTVKDDQLFAIGARGYGSTDFASGGRAAFYAGASENWTDAAQGTFLAFTTTQNGTASAKERLRIENNGNIGIGTTNPTSKLEIYENSANASGQYGSPAALTLSNPNSTSAVGGTILFSAQGTGANFTHASISSYNTASDETGSIGQLRFSTKTTQTSSSLTPRMTIDSLGNVGIGTTAPSYKFQIHSDSTSFYGYSGAHINIGDNMQNWTLGLVYNAGNQHFSIGPSSSEYVSISTDTGNVGIGTTSPTSKLELYENSTTASGQYGSPATLTLTNPNSAVGTGGTILFSVGTGSKFTEASISSNNSGSDGTGGSGKLIFSTKTNKGDSSLTPRMTITNLGRIGIGTTSPASIFQIYSNDVYSSGYSGAHIVLGDVFQSWKFGQVYDNGNLHFSIGSGSSEYLSIATDTGKVGIGNTAPSVALDVTGDIEYTGTLTDVSDIRLKQNVSNLTNSLSLLSQLNGIRFNMNNLNKTEFGFSAQEVNKVFPELVSVVDKENGYLGVNYIGLIPILTNSIKELESENEKLKSDIKECTNKSSSFEEYKNCINRI